MQSTVPVPPFKEQQQKRTRTFVARSFSTASMGELVGHERARDTPLFWAQCRRTVTKI